MGILLENKQQKTLDFACLFKCFGFVKENKSRNPSGFLD
jgi:hypothetical protein